MLDFKSLIFNEDHDDNENVYFENINYCCMPNGTTTKRKVQHITSYAHTSTVILHPEGQQTAAFFYNRHFHDTRIQFHQIYCLLNSVFDMDFFYHTFVIEKTKNSKIGK